MFSYYDFHESIYLFTSVENGNVREETGTKQVEITSLKNTVSYFLFATIRDSICILNSRTRFRGYRGNNYELNKIRSRERNLKISPEISWREKFYFGSFVRDPLQRGFRKWSSSRTRYL